MPKQKGIIKIKGTIGDLSFYTTKHGDVVRTKWGPDKERRKNDPAFAKAEKNSSEFGNCSASGKVFRDAFRELINGYTDSDLNTRVNSLMAAVKNLDLKSGHGTRNVAMGLLNPRANEVLMGFNFNVNAPLCSILKVPIRVDKDTGSIKISGLAEKGAIKFPKGATQVCFCAGCARIEFNEKKSELEVSEVKILSKNSAQKSITVKPKNAPKVEGMDFYILRIGFVQELGGKQYPLADSKCKVAAVVGVG